MHAGRFDEAAALREQARALGSRAGDRNAELFADMLRFGEVLMRGDYADARRVDRGEDRALARRDGVARRATPGCSPSQGRAEEAREQLALVAPGDFAALPFDTNWPSAMGELAEACIVLGDPDSRGTLSTSACSRTRAARSPPAGP